uniref:Uncharacterized protein n=1 Tax=Hemiselmis andersenii TaxID=464988 RepID=A0A6T8J0N5_HEMAN|mmetsp:Transcript_20033/g.46143  ORF Transcript_20033/g.46143 Transcript_20033/m.46143 type:complete len:199 (-) Transcript_20033:311-907(-)
MLRSLLVIALVGSAAAQSCVSTKTATISGGMCEGSKIGGSKTCLASGMTQDDADSIVDLLSVLMTLATEADCRADGGEGLCPSGSTPNLDNICSADGIMCGALNTMTADQCKSDSDCDANGMSSMTPMLPCCDSLANQMKNSCNGVSDAMVKALKDDGAASGACADSNCVSVGASSSLRATFLPAVAAVFALVATAWH